MSKESFEPQESFEYKGIIYQYGVEESRWVNQPVYCPFTVSYEVAQAMVPDVTLPTGDNFMFTVYQKASKTILQILTKPNILVDQYEIGETKPLKEEFLVFTEEELQEGIDKAKRKQIKSKTTLTVVTVATFVIVALVLILVFNT